MDLTYARKQYAENNDAEAQGKWFIRKVNKTDQDERTTVCDMAEKNQSEHDSDICLNRIGKTVRKFKRWAIINVKKQRVADCRTRHRENEREQLKKKIGLLCALCCRSGLRTKTISVVAASG